jgi:hypothetical protein
MPTEPIPTNQTATVVNKVIDGIFNTAVTLGENALYAEAPWLKLPIINQIFTFIVKSLVGKIYAYFALGVTFAIIDVQASSEVSDYQKALAALKAAQASGDLNALNDALSKFNAAASAVTHWDGGANPGSM